MLRWRTQLAKGKSRVRETVLELFPENPFWTTTGIARGFGIAFTGPGHSRTHRSGTEKRCYAVSMDDAPMVESPAAGATGDAKAIIRSIVGTGVGLATLLLMLAGLTIQQNVNVNAHIDDVNTNVNARIDDVNARIDNLQEDIRELRALIIDAIKGAEPAD